MRSHGKSCACLRVIQDFTIKRDFLPEEHSTPPQSDTWRTEFVHHLQESEAESEATLRVLTSAID